MSPDNAPATRPESRSRVAWLVAGLTILALLLRFWHLRDWSFQATEMFTLRDSDEPQFRNPRPLGYLLNYYLVRPLLPLDEFGLRLLPALFGVLAVPVLFLVTRRLVGTGAGLFSALLLAVSPLHLLYSQLARYWSLVFLLSAVYPYALYLGVRDNRRGVLALGVVTAILAALAHPVSILLLGGPALWLLMSYVRPSQWNELWSRKSFRWGALAAVFIGLIIAARFVPLLYGWITQHDQNPGSGQFLLRTPAAPGLKQILYVMAYLESLTFPVAIGAVVGAYLLWGERQRNLTIFLVSVAVFPIVFLALLSLRTAVSQYYLLPTAPAFFLAAGVFLDRVARIEWAVRPRWLLPAALTLIFVASAAPTLVSDLRDGRRFNFRGVALWLKPQLTPADIVFSDQYMVMAHYLPGADVRRLRATDSLEDAWQDLQRQARPGALWIVAPAPSHPFRTNLKRGGLINWIQLHCQLRYIRGVGRVDLRQHYLQVYRCPPIEPQQTDGEAAEGAETQ